jgi:hypothetical protein
MSQPVVEPQADVLPSPMHAPARGFGRDSRFAQRLDRLQPALAALLIQVVATAAALSLMCLADVAGLGAPWTFWALVQAAIAVLLATASGQAPWWIVIHSMFAPAALLLDRLAPPPWIYLGFAGMLALTNPNALRERVPLFLTGRRAREALLELLPKDDPIVFVDAGCGFGGVVATVGSERPTRRCVGLETAWLPWLVSHIRCALSPNHLKIERRDLWNYDLSEVDVLYAYLSPVPMARLWQKACAQMRPGTLLISNSFVVPDLEAERIIAIDDATGSVLYLYRLPSAASAAATTEASAERS